VWALQEFSLWMTSLRFAHLWCDAPLALRALNAFFRAKQSFSMIEETASSQKTSSFAEAQDKRSDTCLYSELLEIDI
jgi:hypothetical protein